MTKSALSIIAEQLPNYVREQHTGGARGFVKGLGDLLGLSAQRAERSVFDPLSEEDLVRAVTHAGTGASAAAVPALRALGPTLRAIAQRPLVAGAAGAAGTALTGDPTWLVSSPVGQALTYSSDAEASKFTDSLKAIDKFIAAHGTPHIFPPTEGNPLGAFDMSKLNTGEGAQAFMAGHYLAGDPKISQVHYRDRLTDWANSHIQSEYEDKVNKAFAEALGGGNDQTLVNMARRLESKGKSAQSEYQRLADHQAFLNKLYKEAYSEGFGNVLPSDFKPTAAMARNLANTQQYQDPVLSSLIENVLSKGPDFLQHPDTVKALKEFGKDFGEATKGLNSLKFIIWQDTRKQAAERARAQGFLTPQDWNYDSGLPTPDFEDFERIRSQLYQEVLDKELGSRTIKLPPSVLFPKGAEFPAFYGLQRADNIDYLPGYVTAGLTDKVKNYGMKLGRARKLADLESANAMPSYEAARSAVPKPTEADLKQGALYSVLVNESPGNMLPLNMTLKELGEDLPEVYGRYDQALQAIGQPSLRDAKGYSTVMDTWRSVLGTKAKGRNLPLELMNEMNSKGLQGSLFLSEGRRKLDTSQEFDPKAFNYVIFNDEVPQIIGRELGKTPKFLQGGLARAAGK